MTFYRSKIAKFWLELDFSLRDQLCPDALQNALRLAIGEVVSIVVSRRDFDQPIDLVEGSKVVRKANFLTKLPKTVVLTLMSETVRM